MNVERVTAVVVTYNRRALLERLLDALTATAGLREVVVVDNASTDGTSDWLAETEDRRGSRPAVHVVRLPTNTGGAGGFHSGMAAALRRGADALWLMDDDGVPADGCLDLLLPHLAGHDLVGPAVVDEALPERLCFPVRLPGRATVLRDVDELRGFASDGVLPDVVIPFNGVLVTRELVERIGLPRQEFFIWGDDVEYLWRARRAGARVATIVEARFRHPSTDELGTRMLLGRATYNHSTSDLKHYCMARNNLVNLLDYRGPLHALAFVFKTVWFYTVTRPSVSRLALSARALRAGLRRDFSGHGRFLA